MSTEIKKKEIGDRFNRLTIIGHAEERPDKRKRFVCRCDCGSIVEVRSDCLTGSHPTMSCGCYHKELMSNIFKSLTTRTKHGESRERIRNIWYLMVYRCTNEDTKVYPKYGGRGIKVCDEWLGEEGY